MAYQIVVNANWVCPTDGASRRNSGPTAAVVVLRNEWGRMVLAGSFYYGVDTNMVAKFKALLDGLRIVREHGLCAYRIFD